MAVLHDVYLGFMWNFFSVEQHCKCELHVKYLLQFLYSYSGETPAESDFQVLEIARKLDMYGVRFHPAADREGTKINLSVAHMGLQVFQVVMRDCILL